MHTQCILFFIHLKRLLYAIRPHKNAQDFFVGAAVLGEFGHPIALEMAGAWIHTLNNLYTEPPCCIPAFLHPLETYFSHFPALQMPCATKEPSNGHTSWDGKCSQPLENTKSAEVMHRSLSACLAASPSSDVNWM